jgi:hypothetical protein
MLGADPRAHLNFEAPAGKVVSLTAGTAHAVHTTAEVVGQSVAK